MLNTTLPPHDCDADAARAAANAIPTGFPALDAALGIPGYPAARLTEIFTASAHVRAEVIYALMRSVQARPAGTTLALLDTGCTFDVLTASERGIDAGRVLVSQPESLGQMLDVVDVLVRSGACDVVVVDEAPDFGRDLGMDVDVAAEMHLAKRLRSITAAAYRTGAAVVWLSRPSRSDERARLRQTTPALRFYASVRVSIDANGVAKVVKNKMAPPFRDARLW